MAYRSEFRIWQDEINGRSPLLERFLADPAAPFRAIFGVALRAIQGGRR